MKNSDSSSPRLHAVLQSTAGRARRARIVTSALAIIATLVVAATLAIALDATLGLPLPLLVALDVALIGIALYALARGHHHAYQGWFPQKANPRHTAITLEAQHAAPRSHLINAVDLAADTSALGRAAVAQGTQDAAAVPRKTLVNRPALHRATLAATATLGLAALGIMLFPNVLSAVTPRLLHPLSHHPPYTPLQFQMAAGPAPLSVGRRAEIQITLSHAYGNTHLPETAEIVFVNHAGQDNQRHYLVPEASSHPSLATPSSAPPPSPSTYTHRITRLDQPQRFYIDTTVGRSRFFTVTPDTTPLFDAVFATVQAPDYVAQKPLTQKLTLAALSPAHTSAASPTPPALPQLRALRGSALTLTAESNVALAHATLSFTADHSTSSNSPTNSPTTTPADPLAPQTVQPTTTVNTTGTYTLGLTNTQGQTTTQDFRVTVAALHDRAPHIDITHPQPLAIAPEGWPVDLNINAKDDIGLSIVTLHAGLEPSATTPQVLFKQDTPGPPRVLSFQPTLDLNALGAIAGSTVQYYASARDTLPALQESGPNPPQTLTGQLAETPMFRLKIISQTEWNKLARAQFGIEHIQAEWQLLEEELNELAAARAQAAAELKKHNDKIQRGEPFTDLDRQAMAALEAQLQNLALQMDDLADRMEERSKQEALYEFEKPYQEQLNQLAKQLRQEADRANAAAQATDQLRKEIAKTQPPATSPDNASQPNATPSDPPSTPPDAPSDSPSGQPSDTPNDPQKSDAANSAGKSADSNKPSTPNPNFTPSDKPGPNAPPAPSGDNPSPTAPPSGPGLPGVRPTLLNDFVQRAQDFQEPGDPFSQEVQQERRQTTDDLRRMQMADEMAYHGERIRAVIIAQHELASKLNDLQWDEPQDLTAQGRERLAHTADQERELRDELEDAALMLRETAELTGSLLPKMSNSAIAFTEKLEALGIYPDLEAAADYAALHEGPLTHRMATTAAHKLEALLADQGQPGKPGNGLDGSFNLPKASIANALKQLGQSRSLSAGSSSGSGSGSGSGNANLSMLGPHTLSRGAADRASARARQGGNGPGGAIPNATNTQNAQGAEQLNPHNTTTRSGPAIAVPGVPARYQNLAAQYFRRLANDAKRQEDTKGLSD